MRAAKPSKREQARELRELKAAQERKRALNCDRVRRFRERLAVEVEVEVDETAPATV